MNIRQAIQAWDIDQNGDTVLVTDESGEVFFRIPFRYDVETDTATLGEPQQLTSAEAAAARREYQAYQQRRSRRGGRDIEREIGETLARLYPAEEA